MQCWTFIFKLFQGLWTWARLYKRANACDTHHCGGPWTDYALFFCSLAHWSQTAVCALFTKQNSSRNHWSFGFRVFTGRVCINLHILKHGVTVCVTSLSDQAALDSTAILFFPWILWVRTWHHRPTKPQLPSALWALFFTNKTPPHPQRNDRNNRCGTPRHRISLELKKKYSLESHTSRRTAR